MLGFPVATMTFPQNGLRIDCDEKGLHLHIFTRALLQSVSRETPLDIHLPDSQEAYWKQRQYGQWGGTPLPILTTYVGLPCRGFRRTIGPTGASIMISSPGLQ